MPNGTRMEGDWGTAAKRIADFPAVLRQRLQRATLQNCVELVGAVKRGIQSGQPEGGERFAPLHPFTIAQRKEGWTKRYRAKVEEREREMGQQGLTAAKPLMNHGDLLRSVTYGLTDDGLSGRVGVNRNAKSRDGAVITNIAKILHDGAVIPVSDKMRRYLAAKGLHLSPARSQIVIPPRPFLIPVFLAYLPKMIGRYRRALENVVPAALPVWKPREMGVGDSEE